MVQWKNMDYREIEPRMKAALFDMDGTLVDSMLEWRKCNVEFLKGLGYEITPDIQARVLQSTGPMLMDYVRESKGVEVDLKALGSFHKIHMYEVYSRGAAVKPGVREYLEHLRSRGVCLVVTTATWTPHTEIALDRCGLKPYFDAICCTDAIGVSKREAAYFDRVSSIIGHPTCECVLFEDALYALESGREAGLLGEVAVADPVNEHVRDQIRAVADVFVHSLAELM